MAKLWFERSSGEELEVAECATQDECMEAISEYIRKKNPDYKMYYIRMWSTNGRTHFDVGSHTEFFHWDVDFNKVLQKNTP